MNLAGGGQHSGEPRGLGEWEKGRLSAFLALVETQLRAERIRFQHCL